SWENTSQRGSVRGRMGRQRSGRADRTPRRCWAGEGVAWRHYLTGLAFTTSLGRFLLPEYRRGCGSGPSRLFPADVLPERGGGHLVDEVEARARSHELLAVGMVVEPELLEGHSLDRAQVCGPDTPEAEFPQTQAPERRQIGDRHVVQDQPLQGFHVGEQGEV